MSKHVGIVAVTADGAGLCYQTICAEGHLLFGANAHPEVTMHGFSLSEYLPHAISGNWVAMGDLMLASAAKLQRGGADFL
ncbi:MAG: aspartate racemase, partial [bacterium]